MNNKYPLVSFVIPTHNRANVIRDCLESVVNQTYKNIEVVVVNDQSTDNTLEILEEYSSRYKFFRFFNNEGKGVSAARNLGIRMAKGDYIAFMDDDDICELFRIEEQMKPIIKSNYEYNFVVSGFCIISSTGKVKRIYDYLKKTDSIGFTVRWLVQRDLLLLAGGFDTEQPNLEEVEYFWRLKSKAKIFYNPIPVVKVRVTSGSLSTDSNKMINAVHRLLKLHSSEMGKYEKNLWIIVLCRIFLQLNDKNGFVCNFSKIEKGQFKLYKLILKSCYLTKSLLLLKIYDKIKDRSDSFLLRKNKIYHQN